MNDSENGGVNQSENRHADNRCPAPDRATEGSSGEIGCAIPATSAKVAGMLPDQAADFRRNGWPGSTGIGGRLPTGISGRNGPEYAGVKKAGIRGWPFAEWARSRWISQEMGSRIRPETDLMVIVVSRAGLAAAPYPGGLSFNVRYACFGIGTCDASPAESLNRSPKFCLNTSSAASWIVC